jgi:hypothetical protein
MHLPIYSKEAATIAKTSKYGYGIDADEATAITPPGTQIPTSIIP